jgi:serine phosphatase RsbU (regulator of sigma subunit)/pSer/pThr/pTyr-binding forkhead associated (FHA) protein
MASLNIVTGANMGERYPILTRESLIGRHPDCQVILRDSTVSRRHARITRDSAGYWVDDVGSQHGTRVNGELIHGPRQLRDGDEIQLSQVKLVFVESSLEFTDTNEPLQVTLERPSTIVTAINVLTDAGVSDDSQSAPKWRALLEITRSLGVSLDLKRILPGVLENIFKIMPQATRGCIMISDRTTGRLRAFAVRHAGVGENVPPTISRTISNSVMTEGKAVLISDVSDLAESASESVVDLKMQSIICAPLIGSANEPIGLIHLDSQNPHNQFNSDDLDILVNIANLVGQAVDHAHLHHTALQFDRRERDLETARQVQQHFLPQERPLISGYNLFDYYKPADAVGGDYFGYTMLPDGQLAIAVGDVAGHGVPAALLMARLCAEARYCLVTNLIPSDAVHALNQQLSKQPFSFFITYAMCVLDPIRHELTIVNAGHMPPLVRRAQTGKVETLGADITSPPLGIDASVEYRQATTQLEPGDMVVLYTDGVTEAPSRDGRRYGFEKIEHILESADSAQYFVEQLLADVRAFTQGVPQEDDVCVVAFSRQATKAR